MTNNKAQIWFTDFAIATVIFSLILLSYYTYTTNISKQDAGLLDELLTDATTISSMLLSEGYPSTWTNESVVRMGLTHNDQIIDYDLLLESSKVSYNKTKKLLGAKHDFFVYFQNESNNVTMYGDDFGLGSGGVTYNIKMAYYWQQNGDRLMLDFMTGIGADVYWGTGGGDNLEDLIDNIDDYKFILIEDCHCDGTSGALERIAEWVFDGGLLFTSEHYNNDWEHVNGDNIDTNYVMGVNVSKRDKGGGCVPEIGGECTEATVIDTDSLLNLVVDDTIYFKKDVIGLADNVADEDADGFTKIANWTDEDSSGTKGSIGLGAIAKWRYGEGEVYYFPDYHANYLEDEFTLVLENAVRVVRNKETYLKITEDYDELVKLERLVIMNSSIKRMVVYVWG